MILDHDPSLTPADKSSLEKTLEKNQDVEDKIENCAVALSTSNETVKMEMGIGSTFQQVEKTLAQNENVEEKMIECADELHDVNKTLAQEVDKRYQLNRELMETGQKLSATQDILSNTQEVLAVAEKATEEASAQLVRSRKVHTKLRHEIIVNQRIEKVLFEEKERLRATLNHICDAVITTDMSGKVTYLNLVAETMTGWTLEEAKGHPLPDVFNIIHLQTDEAGPNLVELALEGKTNAGLARHTVLIQRSGNTFNIEDSATPIRDPHGNITGAVLVFHDITHAQKMATQMTYNASHDALTGLIDRREFERRLEYALLTGKQDRKQHTLLYLDLDQFKIVNDTYGHVAGDELLKQLTRMLQA